MTTAKSRGPALRGMGQGRRTTGSIGGFVVRRARPGRDHRRGRGARPPVRAAAHYLRRLHRVGPVAGLHPGRHPRVGAAPVRQHPYQELRPGPGHQPAAGGRPPDHPRRGRRYRRPPGDLLRLRCHRFGQQADRHPGTAAARRPGPGSTGCWTGSRPRSDRWCSSILPLALAGLLVAATTARRSGPAAARVAREQGHYAAWRAIAMAGLCSSSPTSRCPVRPPAAPAP